MDRMASDREQLRKLIEASGNIVFFGGAGVSTESGIPDFRSVDGLYSQIYSYPPEIMLSHDFFFDHPDEFFEFYRAKIICTTAKPNAAHRKLAELENEGKLSAVITQNIDGLHQAAGSCNVRELHGSAHRNYCVECKRFFSIDDILESVGVPHCECGGIVKPDVVLYGEPLDEATLLLAINDIAEADLLIVGGTSLAVYPAAALLRYFNGGNLVLVNRSATPLDARADLLIQGDIGKAFDW